MNIYRLTVGGRINSGGFRSDKPLVIDVDGIHSRKNSNKEYQEHCNTWPPEGKKRSHFAVNAANDARISTVCIQMTGLRGFTYIFTRSGICWNSKKQAVRVCFQNLDKWNADKISNQRYYLIETMLLH